jgi:hypothetical protein
LNTVTLEPAAVVRYTPSRDNSMSITCARHEDCGTVCTHDMHGKGQVNSPWSYGRRHHVAASNRSPMPRGRPQAGMPTSGRVTLVGTRTVSVSATSCTTAPLARSHTLQGTASMHAARGTAHSEHAHGTGANCKQFQHSQRCTQPTANMHTQATQGPCQKGATNGPLEQPIPAPTAKFHRRRRSKHGDRPRSTAPS